MQLGLSFSMNELTHQESLLFIYTSGRVSPTKTAEELGTDHEAVQVRQTINLRCRQTPLESAWRTALKLYCLIIVAWIHVSASCERGQVLQLCACMSINTPVCNIF